MSVAAATASAVQREPEHRSCIIALYVLTGELVCACGETNGSDSYSEEVHLDCGK